MLKECLSLGTSDIKFSAALFVCRCGQQDTEANKHRPAGTIDEVNSIYKRASEIPLSDEQLAIYERYQEKADKIEDYYKLHYDKITQEIAEKNGITVEEMNSKLAMYYFYQFVKIEGRTPEEEAEFERMKEIFVPEEKQHRTLEKKKLKELESLREDIASQFGIHPGEVSDIASKGSFGITKFPD